MGLGFSMSAPDMRMTCEECVREMHSLGRIVKEGAPAIVEYLRGNYCPTVHDVEECEQHLVKYYVGQLFAIVEHYFIDGALHVCQTAGTCGVVKEYTCDVCIEEWEGCKAEVAKYFAPMHLMAMEKFMIPTEICNSQPVCTGETHPPHPTHPFN